MIKVIKVATDVTVHMTAIGAIVSSLGEVANGDLTQRLPQAFPPSMEKLRHDFNGAITKLADTLASVLSGIGSISENTGAISISANEFSKRIENQAAALEETAAALDQITVNVSNSANGQRKPAHLPGKPTPVLRPQARLLPMRSRRWDALKARPNGFPILLA